MKKTLITISVCIFFINTSYLQSIIGGQQPDQEQFPWMSSLTILDSDEPGCGASLIDPYWVLTAAHCNIGISGTGTVVIDGCIINSLHLDQSNLELHSEWIPVEAVISHENFSLFFGGPDIALIRLSEPAVTTPVTLGLEAHSLLYSPDMPGVVLGWGLTSPGGEGSDTLLYADTYFYDNDECAIAAPNFANAINGGGAICAGFGPNGEVGGAAFGDSGGPLIYLDPNGEYRQIGVVSGGASDATTESAPAVFTKVTEYAEWIDSVMTNYVPELTSIVDHVEENITFKYMANNLFTIQGLNNNENYAISIVDISGRLITQVELENSNIGQVSVKKLVRGIYVLQVINKTKGNIKSERFTISK